MTTRADDLAKRLRKAGLSRERAKEIAKGPKVETRKYRKPRKWRGSRPKGMVPQTMVTKRPKGLTKEES